MNCQDAKSQLDHPDYETDRNLTPDARAHIEGCADCRRYRARLEAILAPGSVLPREIPPARDLWSGIAPRLELPRERGNGRSFWRLPDFLPLAAAAGIAGILAVSLFSHSPPPSEAPTRMPNREIETARAEAIRPRPAEAVEIGFVQTRAALLKRLEAQKAHASPEHIATVEQTLSTLDSAVRDIHAALDRDPYNTSLLLKLSRTRRRELRLLQQVAL